MNSHYFLLFKQFEIRISITNIILAQKTVSSDASLSFPESLF
jgi:hypothetical protein